MSIGSILQIAGTAVGYVFGGPVGGAIGSVIGGALGASLTTLPTQYGPRLADRTVQLSTYGANIPILMGTGRVAGNITWMKNNQLEEVVNETEQSGKGGPTQKTISYTYFATFQLLIGRAGVDGIRGIRRIWADAVLVYDATLASQPNMLDFVAYKGDTTQLPDPTMEAALGIGKTPSYRTFAYIVFNRMPLGLFGNRIPNMTVEFVGIGAWGGTDQRFLGTADSIASLAATQTSDGSIVTASRGITSPLAAVLNHYDGKTGLRTLTKSFPMGYPSGGQMIYVPPTNEIWLPSEGATGNWQRFNADTLASLGATTENAGTFAAGGYYDSHLNKVVAQWGVSLFFGYYFGYIEINGSLSLNLGTTTATSELVGGGSVICMGFTPAGFFTAFLISTGVGTTFSDAHANGIVFDAFRHRYVCVGDSVWTVTDTNPPVITELHPTGYDTGMTIASARYIGGLDVIEVWSTTGKLSVLDAETLTLTHEENLGAGVYSVVDVFGSSIFDPGTRIVFSGQQIWRIRIYGTTYAAAVTLLSKETGELTAADLNVADIEIPLYGYVVGQQVVAREAIDQLLKAVQTDCVEQDDVLVFRRRGSAVVAAIDVTECGAGVDNAAEHAVTWVRTDEVDLPSELTVTAPDPARDYQPNTQHTLRLVGKSGQVQAMQIGVILETADQIQLAAATLFGSWAGRDRVTWSTARKYSRLVPTDPITLDGYRVRIVSKDDQGAVINWEGVTDDSYVVNQFLSGIAGSFPRQTVNVVLPTLWGLLDCPLLRAAEDTPGSYVWFYGTGVGWRGASLVASNDSGVSWAREAVLPRPGSDTGNTTTALANFTGGNIFDEGVGFNISIANGAAPASATRAAVLAGSNAIAVYGTGGWEIVQYRTATLETNGTYTLKGLLRGRLGSEYAMSGHAVGNRVVLLNTDIRSFDITAAQVGIARDYRAVSIGSTIEATPNYSLTVAAERMLPRSPVYLRAARDVTTNDITLTWGRRTRYTHRFLALGIAVPLGESSEAYVVKIWSSSAYTTLKRTITSSSATASYTSAQQVTDFGSNQSLVYVTITQTSATVGAGHELRAAV